MKKLFKLKKLALLSVALLATSTAVSAYPGQLCMEDDTQQVMSPTISSVKVQKLSAQAGKTSSHFDVVKGEMKKAAGVFVGVAAGMDMMQRVQAGRSNQFTETDMLMPIGSAGVAQMATAYALGELSWRELPKYGTTVLGMVVGGTLGQAAATCMQANDDSRDAFLQYGAALGASAGYLTGSALMGTARAATHLFSSFWSTTPVEPVEEALEAILTRGPVLSSVPDETLNIEPVEEVSEADEVVQAPVKVQTIALDATFELQKNLIVHEPIMLSAKQLQKKRFDGSNLMSFTALTSTTMSINQAHMNVFNEDEKAHKALTNEIYIAANEVSKSLKGLFSIIGY